MSRSPCCPGPGGSSAWTPVSPRSAPGPVQEGNWTPQGPGMRTRKGPGQKCVHPREGPVLQTESRTVSFRLLRNLSSVAVTQLSCGGQHSVALTSDRQVYVWGGNGSGQLGQGAGGPQVRSPEPLRALSSVPVVQVAAGGTQSFCLSVSGAVFGWGGNQCGQLGLGDTTDRLTPTLVKPLNTWRTIQICCGREHTAVLTKDGAVFTFGSGRFGQLGHNSFRRELHPRLVGELWGAKVTGIACGSYHTLVLTERHRIFSFGRDDRQQLGRGEDSQPSVALPVRLPRCNSRVAAIFAGENCSYATCRQEAPTGCQGPESQHCLEQMIEEWTGRAKSLKQLRADVTRAFSSACCFNQSFLDRRGDQHLRIGPGCPGLDLALAESSFSSLLRLAVTTEVEAAVAQLLPGLPHRPASVEGLRIYLLLMELLHVLQQQSQRTPLGDTLACSLARLSGESLELIVDWWSSLPQHLSRRYVEVWKRHLTTIFFSSLNPYCLEREVTASLQLLQRLSTANDKIHAAKRLPSETFSVDVCQLVLREDLRRWLALRTDQDANTDRPLVLFTFPSLISGRSKRTALDLYIHTMMAQALSTWRTLLSLPSDRSLYLELRLRRSSLLDDAFRQMAAAPPERMRLPLAVYFHDDPTLTELHKKNFFHHFFKQLMSERADMFHFNDSQTLAWFPPSATGEAREKFRLMGLLCGLALYNGCMVALPFPLVLFKKLLNVEPTLDDMMEFSPCVAEGLRCVLEYGDQELETLCQTFEISWAGSLVDLDTENPGKPVTSANKAEFVEAYINHAFTSSVVQVFQEFRRGFFQVYRPELLLMFQPEELQAAVVGTDTCDWEQLRLTTQYDLPYLMKHPVQVQMFWEVFDELSEEQRRDFLWFLTGSRRAPILGMGQIRLFIRERLDSRDEHYPESLTCHSILELPVYSSKEIMRTRLREALVQERGWQM
ncbi:probable E3 ubiquitin-protein ligase HERC4 isoform X2 [Synchiropus splendidus]|uniref:probable E3 ubiquitin-protein ligase HERC4 isoform X2 n=1 Tax=Synchiropus splendidus TaxID=270530 RepID=UPI00237ECB54|nr:probable E3 ubiquitin-protein ligase HERC4 isoform X2 [Synchiropus splendidus]